MIKHALYLSLVICWSFLSKNLCSQFSSISANFSCSQYLPDSTFFSIDKLDINVLIDSNGNAIVDSLPIGTYELTVFSYGYESIRVGKVFFMGDSSKHIEFSIQNPFCCEYSFNPKVCPKCNRSDMLIPIKYNGYSGLNKIKDEEYIEGGDSVMGNGCNPKKYCKRDNLEF